ncbi:MAG: phosphoglucosamine mutase [Ruminococcus sp.]|jgi:phosphoglucosamine mutase|nr:phosphoglucosamine mutase [Ruminococcus sp.]
MGKLFGTDGARGVAVTELTCEIAMQIGRAAAMVLAKESGHTELNFLIGKDTRVSCDILEAALAAGIASVGGNCILAGIIPTPAVSFLTNSRGYTAGIMISASHNSFEYNGIKLFASTGFKLPDETEEEIEDLINNSPERINASLKSAEKVGKIVHDRTAAAEYVKHIIDCVSGLKLSNTRIAIDCANGASYITAEKIFAAFDAKVFLINAAPNGVNINKKCGSTDMNTLISFVKDKKCDIGLAFDGDADRCLAVDETGAIIDGDRLIAIFARDMKEKETLAKSTAVVTVMTNLGFLEYAEKNGVNVLSTKVGDRYILEQMIDKGYNLGGEQSGHIIFRDHATTGDGELTAVKLLEVMKGTGKPLSELASVMTVYPQVMLNVTIPQEFKERWKNEEEISALIDAAKNELGETGRILVRESGTEPLIRVMAEGKDFKQINRLAGEIAVKIGERIKSDRKS